METKKFLTKKVITFLSKLPYVKTLYKQSLNCIHPNGHYYSPVISIEDIKKRKNQIWKNPEKEEIEGIDLKIIEQKELVLQLSKYYNDFPFESEKKNGLRYYMNNSYYAFLDGTILYLVIRHFRPKRIIEIGSGFSSMAMLDTNELFFNNQIELTFIEPFPERLQSLMKKADYEKCTIIESDVQLVSLDVFKKLQDGDILFIDSTHVSKTGSDVNYILFEILPILQKGVLIHFHDIFHHFEYPQEWVFRGINWNENYILKAFLMYNDKFEIKIFSDYLKKHHNLVFNEMPLCLKYNGSSIWIQRK
jgi:predicted O-methyltransferase YrrM